MEYDVIVLGGGPGGYTAAELLGQAGMRTLCIEARRLGGTCLNEGCIPTKTLLYSGKLFSHAKDSGAYGVHAQNVTLDHGAVIDRKERVVHSLARGVASALKAARADVLKAFGTVAGRLAESYAVEADGLTYTSKRLILATGSVCAVPPIPGLKEGLDSGFVLTSREMLNLRELPEKLTVLGGGVIGLELAVYCAIAGVETTVVEMLDHIGGPGDRDLARILKRNCEALGLRFLLNSKVTAVKAGSVVYEQGGETCELSAEKVLLAIGRRPNTEGFGLEKLGLMTDGRAIAVDRRMQTNLPGVYAVGDVNGRSMLAHTAYREAGVAVNNILGKRDAVRYETIPSVIYTIPELSSVGETEESAAAKGYDVKVIKLPMNCSGRYMAENQGGNGVCKMVFDKKTGVVLGMQVLANYSSEFITSAAICMEMELTAEDMKEIVFPHPTLSEIVREAAFRYTAE